MDGLERGGNEASSLLTVFDDTDSGNDACLSEYKHNCLYDMRSGRCVNLAVPPLATNQTLRWPLDVFCGEL